MGVEIAVIKNKANLIWIIAAGATLTGCASVYQRVPDAEAIVAHAGLYHIDRDWDWCRKQSMEVTRSQFREAAALKCGEDEACREETYVKLSDGRYTLKAVAKGASDGSALGLLPLAAGGSTAAFGGVTVAGMVLGMLSSGREKSLEQCKGVDIAIIEDSGEMIKPACVGWAGKNGLDPNGTYTDEERVAHLLSGNFDRSYIKHGDPVVNTHKTGLMIERRCGLMTPEEFDFVQKRTGIQITKGKKREF